MRGAASTAWRLALVGSGVVVGGLAAVLAASIQGLALVPGGSLFDGYEVGLLPWMDVGTWLVPIGGVVVALAAALAVWLTPAGAVVRLATIPAVAAVAFWALIVWLDMAPRNAVDGTISASSLQTVVYSRPLNTIVFLLAPAAVLLVLAAIGRRGSRRLVTGP